MRTLRCYNPNCEYLIHRDAEYGGFCCRKCHYKLVEGSKRSQAHGHKCERRPALGIVQRAPPQAPENPLTSSRISDASGEYPWDQCTRSASAQPAYPPAPWAQPRCHEPQKQKQLIAPWAQPARPQHTSETQTASERHSKPIAPWAQPSDAQPKSEIHAALGWPEVPPQKVRDTVMESPIVQPAVLQASSPEQHWFCFDSNDGRGLWWWNDIDEDWFLESEPGAWLAIVNSQTQEAYWSNPDGRMFKIDYTPYCKETSEEDGIPAP